jgi:hypothetical protein
MSLGDDTGMVGRRRVIRNPSMHGVGYIPSPHPAPPPPPVRRVPSIVGDPAFREGLGLLLDNNQPINEYVYSAITVSGGMFSAARLRAMYEVLGNYRSKIATLFDMNMVHAQGYTLLQRLILNLKNETFRQNIYVQVQALIILSASHEVFQNMAPPNPYIKSGQLAHQYAGMDAFGILQEVNNTWRQPPGEYPKDRIAELLNGMAAPFENHH